MESNIEVATGWSARVRHVERNEGRAYARTISFTIGSQASLRERDDHPSALEMARGRERRPPRAWLITLQRSPLYQTFTRAARVALELRLT
jgi:hypothetical protein